MFFLFFSIVFFISVCQAIAINKNFICVCEEGVYGVCGKTFLFITTRPFEVGYDQITTVGEGNAMTGNIKIECGPHIYGCIISEPAEIIIAIREKLLC
jgi:hypothetical protein